MNSFLNAKLVIAFGILLLIVVPYMMWSSNQKNKAIALVKGFKSHQLDFFTEEQEITSDINDMDGNIKIIGWKARQKDLGNKYLVSFTFNRGNGEEGYFYEVYLNGSIVRKLSGGGGAEDKIMKIIDIINK